jgi:hypothetical protein
MSQARLLGLPTQKCPRNMVFIRGDPPPKLILMFQGDVLCLRVLGHDVVILSSLSAVKDLLEKRGEAYADRPPLPILEM